MKNTIQEFATELQEMVLEGTSESNIIQMLEDYFNPKTFEEASRPLMKYLGHNHHLHMYAHVTNNLAHLLEAKEVFGTEDYVLD